MTNKYLAALALLLVTIAVMFSCGNQNQKPALADETLGDTTTTGSTVTDNDRKFVATAASGGLMEVELGKLAQTNGASARVKQYGAMLERDHSNANDELKSIAATKNIPVAATMSEHHQKMVNDMQSKKGSAFDKAYMDMMVEDHHKDIEEFKKQSNGNGDAELKAFAGKTLPVLQMHLDSAKAIHSGM